MAKERSKRGGWESGNYWAMILQKRRGNFAVFEL